MKELGFETVETTCGTFWIYKINDILTAEMNSQFRLSIYNQRGNDVASTVVSTCSDIDNLLKRFMFTLWRWFSMLKLKESLPLSDYAEMVRHINGMIKTIQKAVQEDFDMIDFDISKNLEVDESDEMRELSYIFDGLYDIIEHIDDSYN